MADGNGINAASMPMTGQANFRHATGDGQKLFQVVPGVPAASALEQVSCLLDVVADLTCGVASLTSNEMNASQACDPRSLAWASHYLTEAAKAVVDSINLYES